MDKNEIAWQRFYAAMDGDDFATPAQDQDLFSMHGEDPTLLSSALTTLYRTLQNPVPNVVKVVLNHSSAHHRFIDIIRDSNTVTVKFKSYWFPLLTLKASREMVCAQIGTKQSQPFYRHITSFRQEDLGDNWQHISLTKIIHHELDLLFAEEHHWSASFQKTVKAINWSRP